MSVCSEASIHRGHHSAGGPKKCPAGRVGRVWPRSVVHRAFLSKMAVTIGLMCSDDFRIFDILDARLAISRVEFATGARRLCNIGAHHSIGASFQDTDFLFKSSFPRLSVLQRKVLVQPAPLAGIQNTLDKVRLATNVPNGSCLVPAQTVQERAGHFGYILAGRRNVRPPT